MQQQHAFGEESWSLPLNGLTKFTATVGVGIYGLSLRLECGEQYAFVIPEDCEHNFPGGWCQLKLFLAGPRGVHLRYMSALQRTSAPNWKQLDVTGTSHRRWEAFPYEYFLMPYHLW
jgi:hypothetical protein